MQNLYNINFPTYHLECQSQTVKNYSRQHIHIKYKRYFKNLDTYICISNTWYIKIMSNILLVIIQIASNIQNNLFIIVILYFIKSIIWGECVRSLLLKIYAYEIFTKIFPRIRLAVVQWLYLNFKSEKLQNTYVA